MTKADTKESDSKPLTVYQAIAAVQKSLAKEGISKDRTSGSDGASGPKFKFRGIDDVYNTISGLLAEVGLCILPRLITRETSERKKPDGKSLYFVAVEVEYDLVSSHDGSKHTIKMPGEAMDSGDKATNKAMSAAYKYACLQTFCIPTEGDNDADATTHEVASSQVYMGVFENGSLLQTFVTNCIEGIRSAESGTLVKDQKELNLARWNAMKTSENSLDRDGYEKIVAVYNECFSKFRAQAKPATVDAAKQQAAIPASVASDTIDF